jgi:hypothetical protein
MVEKIWNIINLIQKSGIEMIDDLYIRGFNREYAVSIGEKLFIIRENSDCEDYFMPKYSIYLNWRTHDKEADIEELYYKIILPVYRKFKLETILND